MGRDQGYGTGVAFVILATLGWSLAGIFVRLMPGLDGWQLNCWRGYWMAVGLLVYLIAIYGQDTFAKFREIPLPALIAVACFFTLGSTLYVTSLTLVSTATISVIGALSPIFAGLLSRWITGERPGLAAWIAAFMAVGGVAVIAWGGLERGNIGGILLCLLVPMSFAGQTLALRRYRAFDMVPAICAGGFLTFIVTGLAGFFAGHAGGGFDVPPHAMLLLAVMGPVQLSIPLIFYAMGAKTVPAVTLSLIVMLDAVLNPFWTYIGAGEEPEISTLIGGAVILSAVVLSIIGGQLFAMKPRTTPRSALSRPAQ